MSPPLESLLPPSDRRYLQDYHELMLADDEDIEMKPAVAYADAVLANNARLYIQFVRDLHKRGMITVSQVPKDSVNMFCVLKSDGVQQQLILDPSENQLSIPSASRRRPDQRRRLWQSGGRVARWSWPLVLAKPVVAVLAFPHPGGERCERLFPSDAGA